MTVRKANKARGGPPQKVEASLVRFSTADLRMMAGVLILMLSGGLYLINQAVDKAVTKLQLTMAQTYVSKEEFHASATAINQRLTDVHDDVSKIAVEVKK